MAPGSIFHHINLPILSYFLCHLFYLHLYFLHLYKIPKIYLSYHIISIRSHFRKWSWRDWQPLYHVGCEVLICLCRYEVTRAWSPTGLIPWFSNWGKYLSLLCWITLSFQGKNQRKLKKYQIYELKKYQKYLLYLFFRFI